MQDKEREEENIDESKLHKLVDWYIKNKKLVIGVLFALTAICWLTAKTGLTKAVLYIGKLGRPEYTDFYKDYCDEILNTQTNLVMTEFKTILFITGILLLIGCGCVKGYYDTSVSSAGGLWVLNFGLITLGFTMVTYGVLLLVVYKIYSISAIVYILIGIFCFMLLPCANKDFDTDHPDRYEFKIGSYICGVLGVILIVAIGFGNVKNDVIAIKEEKERYTDKYSLVVNYASWEETSENSIYIMLHFYNNHNGDGKDYDYQELKESYFNLVTDNGKSWMLWKEYYRDYYDIYYGAYEGDVYDSYEDAISDYIKLVAQFLFYEGYLYGDDLQQPMLGEEVLDHACEEVDKMHATIRSFEEYDEDITLTFKQPPVVGEDASFEISYLENDGEYKAYMTQISRVSYVNSYTAIEKKDCLSEEEFLIKDDSVYILEFMVMSDMDHCLDEDVKISLEGLDYEYIDVRKWTYGYCDDKMGELVEAFVVRAWITTGDCDGTYQVIEDLKFDVPQGLCEGDSIEAVSGLDVVKTDNPNVVISNVYWKSDYPSSRLRGENSFSREPKMYELHTTVLGDTGYGFSENTDGSINGKLLPIWDTIHGADDFWSGGYVHLWDAKIGFSAYYYRITTDAKHGSLVANYDYGVTGATVTLTPVPDNGYKFRKYDIEIDLKNPHKYQDREPVIVNDTFKMPAAPIKITAIFEKE